MNNYNWFKTLVLGAIAAAMVSCGGDDGCDNDLTGTYIGTTDCLDNAVTADTILIEGEDGDYMMSGRFNRTNIDQEGCTLTWGNTVFGLGEEYIVTFSGNEITIVQQEAATDVVLCTFTGTK